MALVRYKFSTKLLFRSANCQCPKRRMRGKKTRQRKKHAKCPPSQRGLFLSGQASINRSLAASSCHEAKLSGYTTAAVEIAVSIWARWSREYQQFEVRFIGFFNHKWSLLPPWFQNVFKVGPFEFLEPRDLTIVRQYIFGKTPKYPFASF